MTFVHAIALAHSVSVVDKGAERVSEQSLEVTPDRTSLQTVEPPKNFVPLARAP